MSLHSTNLPFIIGVTGNMDLRQDEIDALKERVRQVLSFAKMGSAGDSQRFERLLADMPNGAVDKAGRPLPRPFQQAFASWEGMPHTEILVLSSLAPGADSLVAEVALEMGFAVKAPLPFPHDLYGEASTFHLTDPHASTERQEQLKKENHERQDVYKDLLLKVKPENTFPVCLAHDERAYRSDLSNPEARRRRYYAAGEYIARYSHLLLAIWDDEADGDTRTGTAAVVEARRFGPRPNVLDGDIGVGLPPGGPTLHLYTRRRKNANNVKDRTPLRFLLPEPLPSKDEPENRHERETEGLSLLCRIGQNLDEFNSTTEATQAEVDREIRARFPDEATRKQIETESPPMYAALVDQLRLRRRAADRGRELEDEHKTTLMVLFWLTFFAAVFFHFFAHWHSGEEGHAEHPDFLRCVFGGGSLVLTIAGLVWYGLRKPLRYAERGNDYRALAEGLRVQLHWNFGGVGWSVPANYMQRQRSELDWIRAAIRAASFPYHQFRDWFAKLTPPNQKAVLKKCLEPSWLADQLNYFKNSWQKNQRLLHFFHKLGGWTALTGVLTLTGVFACTASHFATTLGEWNGVLGVGLLALLVGWWSIGWMARRGTHEFEPKNQTRGERMLRKLMWLVDRITPLQESHTPQARSWGQRWFSPVLHFFLILIPSLAVAVLFLGLVHQPRWWARVPAPEDAGIIIGGILLLGGALLVAWAEKALYSELAYQYGTMASLFESAQLRLRRSIEKLEALPAPSPEYERVLGEIQDFLYALGKEALDENAEWLILHRARPLEPVMAG